MGKEDLLRFSDTPFWNRVRLICLILFWLGWVALLVAVIVLTVVMPRCTKAPEKQDWQKTNYYQVYVRSFYDSDEDGVGDIKGNNFCNTQFFTSGRVSSCSVRSFEIGENICSSMNIFNYSSEIFHKYGRQSSKLCRTPLILLIMNFCLHKINQTVMTT